MKFWSKKKQAVSSSAASVLSGQIYRRIPDDNPFAESWQVEVKDVRDEWVLYRFCEGSLFQNESLRQEMFLQIYELDLSAMPGVRCALTGGGKYPNG